MPADEPPPRPRGARAAAALALGLAAAAGAAGCGSATPADLPPAAGPRRAPPTATAPAGRVLPAGGLPARLADDRGGLRTRVDGGGPGGRARWARLLPRERAVALLAADGRTVLARAPAGVGPTHAISAERWLWVTDTGGDALLVFRLRPRLELVRRVFLPGGPYGLALDRAKRRLWVTLTGTNELVELPAHGRPSELRRFSTVRQPDAVTVDSATHRVFVAGRAARQELDPPRLGG